MKKSETRDLIIKTASELFYRNGYNLTGINEVIAVAGIAKATLYSHFKSKEDLCVAYLGEMNQELISNLQVFTAEKPAGVARLRAVLEFLIPFFESDGFNGCWCIRTVAEIPKENDKIKKKIKEEKNAFLRFIETLVEDNLPDWSAADRKRLARRIYLLYEGAIAESHLQDDSWPIHHNLELLDELLI